MNIIFSVIFFFFFYKKTIVQRCFVKNRIINSLKEYTYSENICKLQLLEPTKPFFKRKMKMVKIFFSEL